MDAHKIERWLLKSSSTNQDSFTLYRIDLSGTGETMLATLQSILLEIEQITCNDTPATEVGKRIVANIKSMMNDRARSQKALNDLLESYSTGILPSVVSNCHVVNRSQ